MERPEAIAALHGIVDTVRASTPPAAWPACLDAMRAVPLATLLVHLATNEPDVRRRATALLGAVLAHDLGWGDVVGPVDWTAVTPARSPDARPS